MKLEKFLNEVNAKIESGILEKGTRVQREYNGKWGDTLKTVRVKTVRESDAVLLSLYIPLNWKIEFKPNEMRANSNDWRNETIVLRW